MSKVKKLFISAFIVLNLLSMIRVHVPLDYKFFSNIYRPVDSYLSFFSVYQDWYMFAPNPSRTNYDLSAEVEFTDGSKVLWYFPRAFEMGLGDKYAFGERYRKFIGEGVRKNDNSFMWKDTAKFALRKVGEENFEKIPKRVHLRRYWEDVPLLSDGFRPHGTRNAKMESFRFYTHEVL